MVRAASYTAVLAFFGITKETLMFRKLDLSSVRTGLVMATLAFWGCSVLTGAVMATFSGSTSPSPVTRPPALSPNM